jgi:colicin import membrane protein
MAAAATAQRDALMPRQPRGLGLGFVLAILAHLLLILGLAFGVNWHTQSPQGVQAELWSAVPQVAAPRATAPEPLPPRPALKPTPAPPTPTPPSPPKPVLKAAPEPPQPDPQIAIEKARREEAKREQAREDQQEREKQEREQKQRDAERAEQDRKKQQQLAQEQAQRTQREAAQQAAARDQYLKRMMGQAGATGAATDTGTAQRSSGPSASYAGRIVAYVRPNIHYDNSQVVGNPVASVELRMAPDGRILSRRLIRSSGIASYDDAVLRAVDSTERLPTDVNGVPSAITIDFKPKD